MKQISWPAGLVSHMEEWVDGVPGENLPEWAAPHRKLQILYPGDMVRRGYVYVRVDEARKLRVGDPIQIDRTHTTVAAIGRPETVADASGSSNEVVRACRVTLGRERKFV